MIGRALLIATVLATTACQFETIDTTLRVARVLELIDLDVDGDLDVAASDGEFVATVRNRGDGTFERAETQQLGGIVDFIDVTGDDIPDAIVGEASLTLSCAKIASPLAVDIDARMVATGRGRDFRAPSCLAIGTEPLTADVDGDGARDLVAISGHSVIVSLRSHEGFAGYDPPTRFDLAAVAQVAQETGLAGAGLSVRAENRRLVHDYDADGREELFVWILQRTVDAEQSEESYLDMVMLKPNDASTFVEQRLGLWAFTELGVRGDVDNDGNDDVVDDGGGTNVRVHNDVVDVPLAEPPLVDLGDADFALSPRDQVIRIVIVDFNHDGNQDIVALLEPFALQPNGSIVLGDGAGHFSPRLQEEDLLGIANLAVGDLDGDGIADLVAATDEGKLRLYPSSR